MDEQREKEINEKAMQYAIDISGELTPDNETEIKTRANSFASGYLRALCDEYDNYYKKNKETILKCLNPNNNNMNSNPYYLLGVCKAIFTILSGENIDFKIDYGVSKE